MASELEVDLDEEPDDSAPPGSSPVSPHRSRWARVVLAAVVVAAVAAGVLVSRSLDDDGAPPPPGPDATAEELYPVLGQPQAPGTTYPGAQLAASFGVAAGSERQLGATASATFWVARADGGEVCLLSRDDTGDADPEFVGGSCSTTEVAASTGLRLVAGDGVDAVAVPAGADPVALAGTDHLRVAELLWVDAESAERTAEAVVAAALEAEVVVPSGASTGTGRLPVFLTTRDAPYAVVLACLGATTVDVGVAVDGRTPEPVVCSRDAAFVRFAGDGRPMRVDVEAPEGQVWAAAVVSCRGSLMGPVC